MEEKILDKPEKEIESLSEELLHTYQEINLLYRISGKLASAKNLDDAARLTLDEIQQHIPCERISIMLLDKEHHILRVLASIGIPVELGNCPWVSVSESVVGEVITTGKPILVNNLKEHPNLVARLKGNKYKSISLLSVPLKVNNDKGTEETLGTVNLADNLNEKGYFTSRDQKLLSAVAGQTAIAIKRTLLFEELEKSKKETETAFFYTVSTLARAAESNDEETGNHVVRVGKYAQAMATALGMPDAFSSDIYYFSQMHDVGKMHIPHEILRKKGTLTNEELKVMKTHCKAGADILGDAPRIGMAREIAMTHHERWDGTGYPQHLKGETIPLSGRITMLADIYDALRNARAYKLAFDHKRSYTIITEGDGRVLPSHFAPRILEEFKKMHKGFEEIYEELK